MKIVSTSHGSVNKKVVVESFFNEILFTTTIYFTASLLQTLHQNY